MEPVDQRNCYVEGGSQRPVLHVNDSKNTGARCAAKSHWSHDNEMIYC
jgi:hypothetical protein